MASSYAVTRPEPTPHEAELSIVVAANAELRLRCQTILAGQRISSRGVSLAGAHRLLRWYRPRVLLLDAIRSPHRALDALPALKRLSPETGVLLLGRRRPSTPRLLNAARRGAWGHVAERDLPRDLPKAVRMVAERQSWLPRRLSAAIVAALVAPSPAGERS